MSQGKGSSAELIEKMTAAGGAGSLGVLQSKLEVVLDSERAKNSSTLSRVEWCGHFIPVDNDKVRLALLHAGDAAAKLSQLLLGSGNRGGGGGADESGSGGGAASASASANDDPESEAFEGVYFDLMARYDDAHQLVDRDIANVSKVTLKVGDLVAWRSGVERCGGEHEGEKRRGARVGAGAKSEQARRRGGGRGGGGAGGGGGR